jgi:hypothetical protein
MKKLTQLLKESQELDYRRMNVGEEDGQGMTKEEKRAFVEAVAAYRQLGEMISHKGNISEIHDSIKGIVENANNLTLKETGDWFDRVTVQRHMKSMNESFKVFSNTIKEVSTLQQRLESSYDEIGEVLGKYYEIKEGNEFGAERAKAIASGDDSFEVDGKSYKVTGVDAEDKKNADEFANESMKLTSLIKRNEELTGKQKELDVDSDGDIEADDLADLRAGKKADESVNEAKVFVHNEKTGEKYEVLSGKGKGDLLIAMKALEKSAPSHMKYSMKESVNEGVSSTDMDKIKGAVEAASSFMSVGSELKKLGMKYTFATEPLPIYIIQPTPNNKVAIVNKKYATKPDFVVGDIAVGIMEGKLNEEEIKWNAVENAIINFLKMNTKILDKRVKDRDTDGVKGGLKSIISGLTNAQRNLKLESVNEAVINEADKITTAVDNMLEKWMLELGEPHPNAPNRSYYSFFETKPAQGWWTRGDGARYKQPPFIAPSKSSMPLKDRLKDKSSSIKNETDLMNWLWKKISSLSGAKKLNVSGEFGDGAEAIKVGGNLFVRQKNNPRAISYSTTSILRNMGVWKSESVNEAGYTVKAENPYQFVNGAYAVLSAYLRDEELGPKGKRELQDIIKSLDYMRKYFYFKMSESVNEAVKIKMNALDWGKSTTERNANLDKYNSLKTDKEREAFLRKLKGESLNEEKYTVIDPMGNQKGVGPKIQAISMAKRLGGDKTGHFVVANTNALKARRALEKFKGDFKNPKLKDMMMNLYYESVNERIVKEKVK